MFGNISSGSGDVEAYRSVFVDILANITAQLSKLPRDSAETIFANLKGIIAKNISDNCPADMTRDILELSNQTLTLA